MKSRRVIRWHIAVCIAAAVAVLAGACSADDVDAVGQTEQTGAPTTATAAPQAASTPDSARDEFAAAIAAKDEVVLRSLWPASSWETIGADVLADFEPASENGDCDLLSETRAHCFVFQEGLPFVLGLTMELNGAGTWSVVSVGLDSTN